jgi:hypothetical protein
MQKEALVNYGPTDTTWRVLCDEEDEDKTQTLLNMGEQTCYLHAACRSSIKTRIKLAC